MEENQEYKYRMLKEPITIKHTPIQFECGDCGRLIDCDEWKYHYCPQSIESYTSMPPSRDWDEILMWCGIWTLIAVILFFWCYFLGWDQIIYISIGAIMAKVLMK